ncbi:DNA recombination/repair protein RecA, partial [Candidatus Azambacteria bacterium]|nr:DNA recombination/repair protein RecA [Candidatus Azambacteria bacterium]
SVRIELRRSEAIKDGDKVIGARARAKIVKNKVAPPFRTAEFDIMYNEGISFESDVITMAAKLGALKKSGSWLIFEGEKIGQGVEASRKALKANATLTEKLISEIHKKIAEGNTEEEPAESEEE